MDVKAEAKKLEKMGAELERLEKKSEAVAKAADKILTRTLMKVRSTVVSSKLRATDAPGTGPLARFWREVEYELEGAGTPKMGYSDWKAFQKSMARTTTFFPGKLAAAQKKFAKEKADLKAAAKADAKARAEQAKHPTSTTTVPAQVPPTNGAAASVVPPIDF